MKGDKGAPATPRLSLWGPLSLSLIELPLGWLRQHFQSSSRKDAELLCRLNHAPGFCIKTRGPWRLAAHLANFFGADPQPSGRQQEKHMAQAVSWAPAHLSPSVGWLLGPPLQRSPVWNVPGSRLEQECPHFTSACLWWESSHRKKKNQMVVFQAIAPSGKADAKVIEEEGQIGEMQAMRAVIESQWKRSERRFSRPVADQLPGRNSSYRPCVANIFSPQGEQ